MDSRILEFEQWMQDQFGVLMEHCAKTRYVDPYGITGYIGLNQWYSDESDVMVGLGLQAWLHTHPVHWTDHHIRLDNGEWVAYDEAGLEHDRYNTKWEARDALVIYSHKYLREES